MPRFNVTGELEQDAILAFRRVLSPGGAAHRLHTDRRQVYRLVDSGRMLAWFFPGRKKLSKLSQWLAGGDREYGQGEVYIDFGVDDGRAPGDWREAAAEWQGALAGPPQRSQQPLGQDPSQLLADAVARFHEWRRANPAAFVEEFGERSYAQFLLDQEQGVSTSSEERSPADVRRGSAGLS
jgi:hypothetical protein